jgi:NADH dehydrogenase
MSIGSSNRQSAASRPRVVIIGGGFAGVRCARQLRRHVAADRLDVVVFNRENHMVFHPLLAEVAGASINPDAVAAPLRQFLAQVDCRTETVTGIDLDAREVVYEHHDGRAERLTYDHVVVACGRRVNLNAVPGMSDHAFALKTAGDAMQIRSHVIQQLEVADASASAAERHAALSFVVVGGGFSGVEVAGEINDLIRESRRYYPRIAREDITVTLVHSGDQILPEVSATLRAFARRKMEAAGISIVTGARAAAATPDGIWLTDGRQIAGRTIVCTIGTAPERLLDRLPAVKEKGALVTAPDMRLLGRADAWAIGDCARITNAADGQPSPTTAQFAERQGIQVADNIVRVLAGASTQPFHHEPLGQLCAIGGRNAVAEVGGFRLSGPLAWFFWRAVYLAKLPSWSRAVKVGADWAWELVFRRDLGTLKTDPTERVTHGFFRAGDYIYRQGETARTFYALERGEVEILRQTDGGPQQLVAVLRAGDFFGEMALVEQRPRSASVRARTDVEVTMLGADVFTRLSRSLAPLQQRLVDAVRRRTHSLWTRMPDAYSVLSSEPLASFLEACSAAVSPETTFTEALEMMATGRLDALYVVDERQHLQGVVTRTDLFRAIDAVVTAPSGGREDATIVRYMSPNPITVAMDDSPAAAAELLWSRGLKSLPVVASASDRRVVGCLRAESLMHLVSTRLGRSAPAPAPAVT